MDIKKLKEQEQAYLKSNREVLRQYALAYRDIADIYDHNALPWLSDEVLLSDCAKIYIKKLEDDYNILPDENLKLRAKAASDFFIYKFLSKRELQNIIKDRSFSSYEEVRRFLESHPKYNQIHPSTLIEILEEKKIPIDG